MSTLDTKVRLDSGTLRIEHFSAAQLAATEIAADLLLHGIYHPFKSPRGIYCLLKLWLVEHVNHFADVWVAFFTPDSGSEVPVGVGCITLQDDTLVQLYVSPPYRRQGLGRLLLDNALATGKVFMGAYTDTSQGLYTAAAVPNFCGDRIFVGSADESGYAG